MKRVFAIPIIFFICFVIAVYFLIPRYSDYTKLKQDISQKQERLQQTKAYLLSFQKIAEQLELHEEAIQKIDMALPEESTFASMLNFFQNKTAETGLTLKSLTESNACKQEEEETKIKQICYILNLSGSYSAFENFLGVIETSARLMEVEEITVERSEVLLDYNLLIKVYSY